MPSLEHEQKRLERTLIVAFHRAIVRPLRIQQFVDWLARALGEEPHGQ